MRRAFSGWVWVFGLALLALGVFALIAVPVYQIQPFRGQTSRAIEISYLLRRISPAATLLALGVAVYFYYRLWRASRSIWVRLLAALLFAPLIASAWFARQNHFEWMFNPLPGAAYAPVAAADFVDGDDLVMTVELNGERVAYPVRQMAYHHVVHDQVGGVPIAVTY